MAPHVACKDQVQVAGLDGRTTPRPGYWMSLQMRKRVEEIFAWIKTVRGFRRSRCRGLERTQAWSCFVAGTYRLPRLARAGRSAFREAAGRISTSVKAAVPAAPTLNFENLTHEKLPG